jgi:hypothetical protein
VAEDELRQLHLFTGARADPSTPSASSAAGQARRRLRERLSEAMEAVNRRHGRDAVTLGGMPGTAENFTGAKAAFTRVPEPTDFDDLGERRIFPNPRPRPARLKPAKK